jgi:hypothetical protein
MPIIKWLLNGDQRHLFDSYSGEPLRQILVDRVSAFQAENATQGMALLSDWMVKGVHQWIVTAVVSEVALTSV